MPNVCLHRSAAALAAAEDAGLPAPVQAAGAVGRGVAFNPNPLAALLAPAHTLLSDEKPHFDPVPVYIGPAPGWKGVPLGPRPTGAAAAAAPPGAKAVSVEAPTAPDNAQGADANANASADVQGAVKTSSLDKSKPKPVRHAALHVKAQKTAATNSVKAKTDNTDKAKVDATDKAKTDSTDKDKKDLSTD